MKLYADGSRGIYIPQFFATTIRRDCVTGVTPEDWKVLEAGPDHLHYWDVWIKVTDNAELTDPDTKIKYTLWQDGDLWMVAEGEEIPDM